MGKNYPYQSFSLLLVPRNTSRKKLNTDLYRVYKSDFSAINLEFQSTVTIQLYKYIYICMYVCVCLYYWNDVTDYNYQI